MSSEREQDSAKQDETLLVKVLIPSSSAGVILGKGGETIICLQTQFCTNIKLSKAGDFFPGTMDRVCVILGSQSGIRSVLNDVVDKIRDKPDSYGNSSELKVKLVVPNSTAAMIIGRNGDNISHIQKETSARVQVSQKTHERAYLEQLVTIQGGVSEMSHALDMVLDKVYADPSSNSCPNISYSSTQLMTVPGSSSSSAASTIHTGMIPNRPSFAMLRYSLRFSGFPEAAIEEIVTAVYTLASYGFLTLAEGSSDGSGDTPNLATLLGVIGPSSVSIKPEGNVVQDTTANVSAAPAVVSYVSGPNDIYHSAGIASANQTAGYEYYGQDSAISYVTGGYNSNGAIPPPPPPPPPPPQDDTNAMETITQSFEIGEHVVGALLGPGGRSIIDLQTWSGTMVEVSKKGMYAPGTRNRIVTVSGLAPAVQSATYFIKQCIAHEEMRRASSSQAVAGSQQQPISAPGGCFYPPYEPAAR